MTSIAYYTVRALMMDLQTLLTDACEGVLAPAASLGPNIAALTTFQYGSGTANDQIEARFKRQFDGLSHCIFRGSRLR
jgi:hypothetical protein